MVSTFPKTTTMQMMPRSTANTGWWIRRSGSSTMVATSVPAGSTVPLVLEALERKFTRNSGNSLLGGTFGSNNQKVSLGVRSLCGVGVMSTLSSVRFHQKSGLVVSGADSVLEPLSSHRLIVW